MLRGKNGASPRLRPASVVQFGAISFGQSKKVAAGAFLTPRGGMGLLIFFSLMFSLMFIHRQSFIPSKNSEYIVSLTFFSLFQFSLVVLGTG